jgi:hypothetical protein
VLRPACLSFSIVCPISELRLRRIPSHIYVMIIKAPFIFVLRGSMFLCTHQEDKVAVKSDKDLPFLRNPEILIGENDLTSLSYLHEPAG